MRLIATAAYVSGKRMTAPGHETGGERRSLRPARATRCSPQGVASGRLPVRAGNCARIRRKMQPALFRKFALFAELDDRELASIAAVAKIRRYAKDDAIFHEEEAGDIFCVIREGRVKVTMTSPEGKEIILSTLGPNDFFGEMALLDEQPRSANVIAIEPLEVVTIWRSDFLQILSENFSIARKVLAEMSRRLRSASSRIESLATVDVYGRLARFFLELAQKSGKVLDNGYVAVTRPTHQSIANTIGTSRETVSRLIHDLMRQNLLLSEGKTIYLRQTALDQFKAEM